jgi:hypothetical protein
MGAAERAMIASSLSATSCSSISRATMASAFATRIF